MVAVSLRSRFFCFLLGFSPHVSECSPGTSVNYSWKSFQFNQEEPLCTRGQYVTQKDQSRSDLQTVALQESTGNALQELPFHQTESKLPTFSESEIHLLLLPCLDSFTVAYWLLLSSLLGPISSGLMHLKRNKGLGGSQTFFSPLLTGTAPFYHASSPTKTAQNQTLTPFKCLAEERGRLQLPFPSE